MDTLTTSEVGLGSAAITTALVNGLRAYGLAGSQKLIFLWSLGIAVVIQVVYVLSQGQPANTQNIAAAILAGITSALAAGGLHDHATAAGSQVKEMLAPPPSESIFSGDTFQRSLDAIDADATLTPEQKAAAKAALNKFRAEVKPPNG